MAIDKSASRLTVLVSLSSLLSVFGSVSVAVTSALLVTSAPSPRSAATSAVKLKIALPPAGMLAAVHSTDWPSDVQSPLVQVRPAGNVSLTSTLVASDGPAFSTVMR